MQEEQAMYLKLKEEMAQIKAGQVDDRLIEMCQQIEEWVWGFYSFAVQDTSLQGRATLSLP